MLNKKRAARVPIFRDALAIPFRVRAAVLDKARIGVQWKVLNPPELVSELIIRLTLRANPLDIANEILVIDGTTLILCKHLRMQFTERCKQERRIRPFKNIAGGNSRNEDGFQLADMMAGAIRLYAMRISADRFYYVSQRIVDLWELY